MNYFSPLICISFVSFLEVASSCHGVKFDEPGLQVTGIMDKSKDEGTSNHEHVMAAFDEASYTVVYRKVDPGDAKLPVSRARVHYIGVHRDALKRSSSADKFSPTALSQVWEAVSQDVRIQLPETPLDLFLWGSFQDKQIHQVPTMKQVIESQGAPEKKKRRTTSEPAWPDMHKLVMQDNGAFGPHHVIRPCHSTFLALVGFMPCFHVIFVVSTLATFLHT